MRSLLSIFVLGTALRDSYCVPLWAKAIVPSSDRFPLFRPVFMQSAVQVRSIHRIIDRGSRSSSIIFLLFRWKEISLFSFFLRERFIIIKIYLLVLVCLPFEYNTIIFGEDRKIGVGLLFRTKPVPNKNLDGSRRATDSSASRVSHFIDHFGSDRGKRIPATSTFSLLSSLLATQAIDEAKCARSWADKGNRWIWP